jgi:hypothetical protein
VLDEEVERLRADDITGKCYDLTAPVQTLGEIFRLASEGRGEAADLATDLLGRDLDPLLARNRLEHQVGLDRPDRVVARVGAEPQLVEPLRLEQVVQRHPGLLGTLLRVHDPVLHFFVDERVGQLDVHRVDHRLEHTVANIRVGRALPVLAQLLAQLRP